jgi:NAD(P)-dependent dehydrogenase (short-subunit alcohol dehydrogenase family)
LERKRTMSNDNSKTQFLSNGQVALVTGSGRGIGRATALALAQSGTAAAVALTARSVDQLEETRAVLEPLGMRTGIYPADMADAAAVAQMVAAVERDLGPVDLLVNNAATDGPLGPTWEADAEEWWRCFEVNLRAPFQCAYAVLPGMIERRRGRIINVASGAGTRAIPHMNAYATSKAALIRFSEVLALEAQPSGVHVFALDPGPVHTTLVEQTLSNPATDQWMPWFRDLFQSDRVVPPERAAQLVVRLASGEADALTGRFVSVFHDMDRLIAEAETIQRNGLYTLGMGHLEETEPA